MVSRFIGPLGVTHKVPWPLDRVGLRKMCTAQDRLPPRLELQGNN